MSTPRESSRAAWPRRASVAVALFSTLTLGGATLVTQATAQSGDSAQSATPSPSAAPDGPDLVLDGVPPAGLTAGDDDLDTGDTGDGGGAGTGATTAPAAPATSTANHATSASGWTPAQSTKTIRVMAISDFAGSINRPVGFQGQLLDSSGNRNPAGGGAYLAATVDKLRDQSEHSLLVSAGDNIGDTSAENALLGDRPTISFLNRLGIQASAIGDRDLEAGHEHFTSLVKPDCRTDDECTFDPPLDPFRGAAFPYIAANAETGPDSLPVFPYAINRVAGERIGIVSITMPSTNGPDTEFEDPAQALRGAVDALRFLDVSAIVGIVHSGRIHDNVSPADCPEDLKSNDFLRSLPAEIDAVVLGDSGGPANCRIATREDEDRVVIAPASHGRSVSVVDLVLDESTGQVVRRQSAGFNQVVNHDIAPARWVEELSADATRAAEPEAREPIGEAATEIPHATDSDGESPLANVVSDALLAAGRPGGADFAISNPDSLTADLPVGPITYAGLHRLVPYGDRLFRVTLTGDEVRRAFEYLIGKVGENGPAVSANVSYRVDLTQPAGSRLAELRIDGDELDPDEEYTLVVAEFLASAEWLDSPLSASPEPLYLADAAALRSYVAENSPLSAPAAGRVSVTE